MEHPQSPKISSTILHNETLPEFLKELEES